MEGYILRISMMLVALAVLCTAAAASDGGRLRLATTTSLHDTGLLDVVKQKFEEKYNVSLDVIAVGSGAAIKLGETGDADVLLVHDKDAELKFVASGNGLERRCIAYNYFYVVGPKDDPAGIKGLNATRAFERIREEGKADPEKIMFVSRGDNSGTYTKEKNLWKAAGYNASKFNASDRWYISAGQGMGATLMMTNEKNAYTLSDMSTFMAYNVLYKGNFTLIPLIEGGNELLNVYTAIAVSPKKHPGVNCEMATNLINFLVSDEGQKLIADYGVEKFGHQLFFSARGNCPLIGCSPVECAVPTNASCATA
jgi:tungstate transport system substrate-binding protein